MGGRREEGAGRVTTGKEDREGKQEGVGMEGKGDEREEGGGRKKGVKRMRE